MDWEKTGVAAAFVLVLLISPACWVIKSHFEAKAYNRITGAHVSTWEAMFVELRVQEGARGQ